MITTVSLETAKLLKEAGLNKKAMFLWVTLQTGNMYQTDVVYEPCFEVGRKTKITRHCWAYTTDELLAELPFYLVKYGEITLKKNHLPRPPHSGYHCLYQKTINNKESSVTICADTSAECLARMYLYLAKERLL